jgi:serine/threonine protein kinase/Tol biopolymer transport system component
MSLAAGSRVGAYEIISALGVGGMGEVWRATDTRLKRQVALKVLPAAFVTDPERIARFQREAEVLAALNHPNIAQIYGIEEAGGVTALVLELVEGPTLSDRIAKGPIPIDEALPIAKQIAEALEAAHEQGIIHRDLKPANIKVRDDGTVKVLDFGLAKLAEPGVTSAARPASSTESPTITSPAMMTGIGVLLGTAAYMSPEQAKGRAADRRSDIWAFGCVLYEMLTGEPAFRGDEISETLAAVIKDEPDWTALPSNTPESIQRLLRRCLAKERGRRLSDAGAARLEIDEANQTPTPSPVAVSRTSERIAWLAALVLTATAAVTAMVIFRPAVAPTPELRLEIATPPTTDAVSFALSPDAANLVFVAATDGPPRLWVRSLRDGSTRPLAQTAGAIHPFWSPDSQAIGFFADGKLKRIQVDGSALQVLANAPADAGATWSRNNVIVFAPTLIGPLYRVASIPSSSEPTTVTRVGGDQAHRFPQFLPDGRHFFYSVVEAGTAAVYLGSLENLESRRLLDADAGATLADPGHLVFVRQGTLFAQPFDSTTRSLRGEPVPLAEVIAADRFGHVGLSTSPTGGIAYRTGSGLPARQFIWFDRTGNEIKRVGDPDAQGDIDPVLSVDEKLVALRRGVGHATIWFLNTDRGQLSRFGEGAYPLLSPTGRDVMYSIGPANPGTHQHTGPGYDLFRKPIDGGIETPVFNSPEIKTPMDWSSDGAFVLYRRNLGTLATYSLWALPLDGSGKPIEVSSGSFTSREGQFSPDVKWIAYQSDESGQFEIYLQRFPGKENKTLVSVKGGAQVRWRSDGKELFYLGLDGRLMAVPVQLTPSGPPVIGDSTPLFMTQVGTPVPSLSRQQYVVSNNGQRFLMNTVLDEGKVPGITLLLNWKPQN